MNLKKIKDAATPEWVRKFEKMSKGMPYYSEYDPEYDTITVKVSGFVDYIEPTANEWMKKAYEADSEEEMLNDDRWNPSCDVAEEALEYVCKKLGLEGYDEEVGAAPEMDMFWISNPKNKIKDSNKSVRQSITNTLVGHGFIVDYIDKVDSTHWSAKVNNLTEIMPFVTNNSNTVINKACDWLKQNLGVGDAYDVELLDSEGNGYIEIFID